MIRSQQTHLAVAMQNARNVTNAAPLRTAIVLLLLAFGAFVVLGQTTPTTTTSKKRTTAQTAPKTGVKHIASGSKIVAGTRRSTSAGAKAEAYSATHRIRTRRVVVTRKLVHGKWVRTTQVVRAPPAPSYQLHPDTERYQQIQQALANAGYFKGPVNGEWGDDSVEALKQFQTDHKLVNDGKISSLSLIGLGLGPSRDTAAIKPAVPVKDTAVSAPPAATAVPPDPTHN